MSKCLFTYESFSEPGEYSPAGLKQLHPKLHELKIFPYDLKQQKNEVLRYSGKLSIQGVQSKLSANLSIKNQAFELTEIGGHFIFKPDIDHYPELPANEDLTMHLAKLFKINTPWHGLIKAIDESLIYSIKRFDRAGKGTKVPQEDFAQLIGATRSTKYSSNMEKVAEVVEKFCSFYSIELEKIFRLTIFSYLIGNEDLHLKNFSLQTTNKGVVQLTPAYDLVNSTIVLANPTEEMALELNGKKSGFTRQDFIDYYAVNHLHLKKEKAAKITNELLSTIPEFKVKIQKSFLSSEMKLKYFELIEKRAKVLSSS